MARVYLYQSIYDLATSVPIDFEAPTESIQQVIPEFYGLRDIVEPHIEAVAAAHQPE